MCTRRAAKARRAGAESVAVRARDVNGHGNAVPLGKGLVSNSDARDVDGVLGEAGLSAICGRSIATGRGRTGKHDDVSAAPVAGQAERDTRVAFHVRTRAPGMLYIVTDIQPSQRNQTGLGIGAPAGVTAVSQTTT